VGFNLAIFTMIVSWNMYVTIVYSLIIIFCWAKWGITMASYSMGAYLGFREGYLPVGGNKFFKFYKADKNKGRL
jgi:hypothetical protein